MLDLHVRVDDEGNVNVEFGWGILKDIHNATEVARHMGGLLYMMANGMLLEMTQKAMRKHAIESHQRGMAEAAFQVADDLAGRQLQKPLVSPRDFFIKGVVYKNARSD